MLRHLSFLSNVEIRDIPLSPRVFFKSTVLCNLGFAACKPPACGPVTGSFLVSMEENEPGVQAAEGCALYMYDQHWISSTASSTSDDEK